MSVTAVLTADMVNSRALDPGQLGRLLSGIGIELENELFDSKRTFIIYRGDSFQAVLAPADALKVALLWRAAIMKSDEETARDIRIAIGIGEISYKGTDPGTSSGPVFEYSGLLLDEMKKSDIPRIQIRTEWDEYNRSAAVNCYLAEGIIRRWTAPGAEAIYYQLLKGETQQQLALRFGIAQSSVHRRLAGADWLAIQYWEGYYRQAILEQINSKR